MKLSKTKSYMSMYMKEYIRNSEPVECICGATYKPVYRYKHVRSKKHLAFIKFNKAFKTLKEI